jgi:hypothetical protein
MRALLDGARHDIEQALDAQAHKKRVLTEEARTTRVRIRK